MKRAILAAALLATPALAQTLTVEQADQALSISRIAGANEISIKEQRIAGLAKQLQDAQAEIERLKKAAAECQPKKEDAKK